jgi:hypothetical protein
VGFQQHGEIKLVFYGISWDYVIIFDIPSIGNIMEYPYILLFPENGVLM